MTLINPHLTARDTVAPTPCLENHGNLKFLGLDGTCEEGAKGDGLGGGM